MTSVAASAVIYTVRVCYLREKQSRGCTEAAKRSLPRLDDLRWNDVSLLLQDAQIVCESLFLAGAKHSESKEPCHEELGLPCSVCASACIRYITACTATPNDTLCEPSILKLRSSLPPTTSVWRLGTDDTIRGGTNHHISILSTTWLTTVRRPRRNKHVIYIQSLVINGRTPSSTDDQGAGYANYNASREQSSITCVYSHRHHTKTLFVRYTEKDITTHRLVSACGR